MKIKQMTNRVRLTVVATALTTIAAQSTAAPYSEYWTLHSACPDKTNKHSWPEYMSAKFPDEPWPDANPRVQPARKGSGQAGVEFRFANRSDPKALPGIDPSACYLIMYYPTSRTGVPAGYRSLATYSERDSRLKEGLPGDPAKYQINVDGMVLKYNAKGQVLDRKGRVAGVMTCYHKNNTCEQYHFK